MHINLSHYTTYAALPSLVEKPDMVIKLIEIFVNYTNIISLNNTDNFVLSLKSGIVNHERLF